ncbi:MAG TPA: hypothetical protein VGQ06_03920 [Gemmatimonadales bacterium]|nr:hypothetical protein [Gemmatimonadales bacterium]
MLHEIRPDTGGPVDSAPTNAAGRYRLTLARRDTAATYFVVTTYQDVEYFSEALGVRGAARVDASPLLVYDTTTAGPPMRIERRLVTLFQARGRDGRAVIDVVEVSNPGTRTRVAPDSLRPVWTLRLPAGARGWALDAGNLVPEAIRVRGDTVKVFAPIWPGAPLRMSQRYALSGSTVRVPLDQWTGELGLLVEDTTAAIAGPLVQSLGVQEFEGHRFAAYRGGAIEAGAEVRVAFGPGRLKAEDLLPYAVAALALALGSGLWIALRRKPSSSPKAPVRGGV